MPAYPSDEMGEADALDEYVFGDWKDDQGFIPTLDRANELLERFARSSRRFEVIYASQADRYDAGCVPTTENFRFLGFDVASGTPFWSIVADLPRELLFVATRLNENGLLDQIRDAKEYLAAYHASDLADDSPFLRIWDVYLVQ